MTDENPLPATAGVRTPTLHTLRNDRGMLVRLGEIGASIIEVHTRDRNGDLADITLGMPDPDAYADNPFYFGSIVGRCANRIGGGAFEIDGRAHTLPINNGPNHIHGGIRGFNAQRWTMRPADCSRGDAIAFELVSPAGDEGYPGALTARVTYTVTPDDRLICQMEATTDEPTLCNLVQHAYWNLGGHDSGTIDDHVLTLNASRYTPTDADVLPTGELEAVRGTALDFRTPTRIGDALHTVGDEPHGYDHNFSIDGISDAIRPVARLEHPGSGRVMALRADQPGVQLYTGNFLDGTTTGKHGASYPRHSGLCLESQCFPNAINTEGWVKPILRPGETYRHTVIYAFGTDRDES